MAPKAKPTTAETNEAEIQFIPREKLVHSPYNVRQKQRTPDQVAALAALIKGRNGIIQNLIVHPITKKNRPTGEFGVCAGEGRRLALNWLAERGELVDYLPPCKVVSEDEAIAMSIAENSGRIPMHAADQFEAFQRLVVEQGKPVEDVAAQFGVAPIVVRQRLKLAELAPDFIEMFRNDKINLDALMALTLIEGHEQQRTLWNSLPEYQRHAGNIRRMATPGELAASHFLARFVGEDAYRAAGGPLRVDLFGGENDKLYGDRALLETLALKKLQIEADLIENEPGVAWVEVHTEIGHEDLNRYGHTPKVDREPTDAEAAEIAQLQAAIEKIEEIEVDEIEDDAERERLETEYQTLDNKLSALMETLSMPDPAALPYSGAIVTINHKGDLLIHRGRIRPDDVKLLKKQSSTTSTTSAGGEASAAPAVTHSERLVRMLTAERTAAIRASVAARPDVALVILATRLAERIFGRSYFSDYCLKISAEHDDLTGHAPNVAESRAGKELAALSEQWGAAYKAAHEAGMSTFGWLLAEPAETVNSLLAFCIASSIDTVQMRDDSKVNGLADLTAALDFDMADWWTATADAYFSHVPKPRIVSVMAANGAEVAPLAAMKKGDLATAAETHFAERRWLPELLQAA